MDRRIFLKSTFSVSLILSGMSGFSAPLKDGFIPVRITEGPNAHWFGYYDKFQIDPTGRYALGARVYMEGRSPAEDDSLTIGLIDLHNNQWRDLGTSGAWSWQQGCMLQWIPGSLEEVIWNDRDGDHFISRIINIKTGEKRELPKAVYALSPDGKWAIGTEFSRIQNLRPGYGYAGIADPFELVKSPKEIGLYKIDLKTGVQKFLFSLADIAAIPHQGVSVSDNFHWFNHLLINTDGTRFTFLHRWRTERTDRQKMATGGFVTRMFTASSDGDDLYVIDPSGYTSHFVWRDPSHICAWTQPVGQDAGFYLLEDKTGKFTAVGKGIMTRNGHNTYVPNTNNKWILNDTYPNGKERFQELYLFHIPTERKVLLGKFFEPDRYKGEWRCDLHPRCNQQGTKVFFDSTHEGQGRQMYCINIGNVVR